MDINGEKKTAALLLFGELKLKQKQRNQWISMESRPRDDKGKFIESSPFGKKLIAVRLFKSDQEKFFSQSEKLGISPTELARKAITEWLNEKEQPTKTA